MMRLKRWPVGAVISICLVMFGVPIAMARDLGQAGSVYPIIEKSVTKGTKQPRTETKRAHRGLPHTMAHSEQHLDLGYTVPEDITDEKGNIFYPKGYRFNPFEHRRFRTMIVIDGSDPKQIDWATTVEGVDDPMTRIVITEGSQAEVSKRFKRRVYRLHPQVAKRYRITSVPTVLQQKGASLAVTAIPVD